MPGHQTHTAAAVLFAIGIVAGKLAGDVLGWGLLAVAIAAFLASSIPLTPDLDTASHAYYSIPKFLRWLVYPYVWAVPHRSWFSHGPVIGTLARTLYLGVLLTPVALVLWAQGVVTPDGAWSWLSGRPEAVVAVMGGLEAGTLVHLALDKTLRN